MSKIIIGIGCSIAQELPASVLSYSINQSARTPIVIEHLHRIDAKNIDAKLLHMQRTAFSLQRFLLAKVMLQRGCDVGIYFDSDMIVLRPVDELVKEFHGSNSVIATAESRIEWRRQRQSSVMVMNQEGAKLLVHSFEQFIAGAVSYDDLIYLKTVGEVGSINSRWNALEFLDQEVALLHYTDMDRQPWVSNGNPNAGIWYSNLWHFCRRREGLTVLKSAIEAGYVRPSLWDIVEMGPSISARSNSVLLKDALFVPAHRFQKVTLHPLRKILAPMLKLVILFQSVCRNGQINIR